MGCDIHGWVEVRVGDKFIATMQLKDRDRNYARFAALAGVRNYHEVDAKSPKGIPADVSDTAGYDIEKWDSDGHSHSYIPIKEAATIFLATAWEPRDFAKEYPLSEYFDFEEEEDEANDARLVFWFDN